MVNLRSCIAAQVMYGTAASSGAAHAGSDAGMATDHLRGTLPSGSELLLSTRRREFFDSMHGGRNEETFEMYGIFEALPTLEGEHLDIVQRVCTGREPETTHRIAAALHDGHEQ